jgi:hypothetical protein
MPTPAVGGEEGLAEARAARRRLIAASLAGLALAGVPGAARAQARAATPRQTAGPFYPRDFPADDDNDLVSVKGQPGIAKGELLLLTGVVVDTNGKPVAGARVEIWQCNALGRYHHPGTIRARRSIWPSRVGVSSCRVRTACTGSARASLCCIPAARRISTSA